MDPVGKSLQLRFADVKLDWCKGSVPTADGPVELDWKKSGERIVYRLVTPPGYRVEIENRTGRELVKE